AVPFVGCLSVQSGRNRTPTDGAAHLRKNTGRLYLRPNPDDAGPASCRVAGQERRGDPHPGYGMAATMKRFGIGLLLCAACTVAYAPAPVRLVQAWELSTALNRPESVVYDAERDVLYVANITAGAW